MSDTQAILDLPKVELHLHLDCSMSFESVSLLVPGMTRERYRAEFLAPQKCVNLVDYFRYLAAPLALLQTAEGLRVAASSPQAAARGASPARPCPSTRSQAAARATAARAATRGSGSFRRHWAGSG